MEHVAEGALHFDLSAWCQAADARPKALDGQRARGVEIRDAGSREAFTSSQSNLLRYAAYRCGDFCNEHPAQIAVSSAAPKEKHWPAPHGLWQLYPPNVELAGLWRRATRHVLLVLLYP